MAIELKKNTGSLTLGNRYNSKEEIYVGESAPTKDGYKVWVDADETEVAQIPTKEYVDEAIANMAVGGEVDLTGYAKKDDIPVNVSELKNDAGYLKEVPQEYITETELNAKKYASTKYVDDAIAEIDVSGGGEAADLSNYYTKDEVDDAIAAIELQKGEKGDSGEDGYTPVKGVDYYTEAEKQALIEEIIEQIPAGEALPASEEVEF